MNRRCALLALVVLANGGFTAIPDPGSSGVPIVWPSAEIAMVIQQDGSDDVDDNSDIEAIRAALAAWGTPTCTRFHFVDAGLDTSRDTSFDGVNRITFLEDSWPGGADGAAAFTTRRSDTGVTPQVWVESDLRINGIDFRWATDGAAGRLDIQSIVTHELGHSAGLQHSTVPEATMYFSTSVGVSNLRTLHGDDVAGICYLYPAATFVCASDGHCPMFYSVTPLRMHCQAGSCAAGPAGYGAECYGAADCRSGLCETDPLFPPAYEPGFCTEDCALIECPLGSRCDSDGTVSRCYPGRDDCLADADCGGPNDVCKRDLDGRFRCLHRCLQNSHCASVVGAVCHWGTGQNPPGYCRVPGPKHVGDACAHGLECRSLACTGGGAQPTCADGAPGYLPDAGPAAADAAAYDGAGADSAHHDTGAADAGMTDTGMADTEMADTEMADTGMADLATADVPDDDAAISDGAPVLDGSMPDRGSDASPIDALRPDAPAADASAPEASARDAIASDAPRDGPALADRSAASDGARVDSATPAAGDAAVAGITAPPDPDCGCRTGTGQSSPWWLAAIVAALAWRRRPHGIGRRQPGVRPSTTCRPEVPT